MEELVLLRDIFDLLNSYEVDALPNQHQAQFKAMRERIDTYLDTQGFQLCYPEPEKIALFHKNGGLVSLP